MKCVEIPPDAEEMFDKHKSLVKFAIAKYFYDRVGIFDSDDILQTGYEGLWKAVLTYDKEKGEFTTYAVTVIRNQLQNYCMSNQYIVHVPMTAQRKAIEQGRSDEIVEMGKSESLDEPIRGGEADSYCAKTKYEIVGDRTVDIEEEAIVNVIFSQEFEKCTDYQKGIIRRVLAGEVPKDICKDYGCTPQNIYKVVRVFREKLIEALKEK